MDLLHDVGEFDVRGRRPSLQAFRRSQKDIDTAPLQFGAGTRRPAAVSGRR